MSQGMPSMTALLGMLALAGYQNRDKITEMLTGAGTSGPNTGAGQSGLGGLLGSLGGCWAVPAAPAAAPVARAAC